MTSNDENKHQELKKKKYIAVHSWTFHKDKWPNFQSKKVRV